MVVARFHQMPEHERREVTRHRERERPAHHGKDVRRSRSRGSRSRNGHEHQQHAGNGQPPDRRRVRIDHLVVDVVRQRIGDGEQQSVGGRERRRQAARCHQARDHVGKSRDLRGGEHDHVRIDHEVREPDNTRMPCDCFAGCCNVGQRRGVLAADLNKAKLAPFEQPGTDSWRCRGR